MVEWKGDSENWVPVRDLNNSNSTEEAVCVTGNRIEEETDFNWGNQGCA